MGGRAAMLAASLLVAVAAAASCQVFVSESTSVSGPACGTSWALACARLQFALQQVEESECEIAVNGTLRGRGNEELTVRGGRYWIRCHGGGGFQGANKSWARWLGSSVTVRDCTWSAFAPALWVGESSTLTLTGCAFSANQGALVLTDASSATISNCTWVNNNATQAGGSLSITGGSLALSASTFIGGGAATGAHLYAEHGAQVKVADCTFSQAHRGASMSVQGASVTANSSRWIDNRGGGSVLVVAGRVLLNDTVFQGSGGAFGALQCRSPGPHCEVDRSIFRSNTGFANAYVDGGSLRVSNTRFIDSDVSKGGAVTALTEAQVVLTACTIANNRAQTGGAVYAQYGALVWISNTSIVGNAASIQGGAMWCSASKLTLAGVDLRNNSDPLHRAGDAMVECAVLPVHSPCQVVGINVTCADPAEPAQPWNPLLAIAIVVSVLLLLGAAAVAVAVVRSQRAATRHAEPMLMTDEFVHDEEDLS